LASAAGWPSNTQSQQQFASSSRRGRTIGQWHISWLQQLAGHLTHSHNNSLPVAAGVAEQLVSGTLVGFSSWLAI